MSRHIRFFTTAGIAFALLLALTSASAIAASPRAPQAGSIRIEPATQRIVAGQTFTVSIAVLGGANVNSFGSRLNFDPAVIQYVSLATGNYLAPAGTVSPLGPTSGAGYVDYGEAVQGLGSVSGDGVLATLTLRALVSGQSNLQLDPAFTFLVDSSGNDLGAALVNGTMSAYQVYAWNGGTSADWTVGSNWTPAGPPTQYDDAIIPGTGVTNWPSLSALSAVYNLTVQAGAALTITNNAVLNVESAVANNGALTEIKPAQQASGTTEFLRIRNAAGTVDKYRGVDITPAADMNSTSVTIKGNQSQCTTLVGDQLIKRCFNIAPTNTTVNATLRFWFNQAELNSQTANALKVWHFAGTWTQVGTNYIYSPTCGSGALCWMQADGIASYSPFALGGAQPTAITLRTLTARTDSITWLPIGFILLGATVVIVMRRRSR